MSENAPISLIIKIINNSFDKLLNSEITFIDLTSSQSLILGYLTGNQDKVIFQKDLETQFNFKHSTVTGILQRLEAKGFTTSVPYAGDHRYKRIMITEKSREIQTEMEKLVDKHEKRLMEGLSEAETGTLSSLLHRIMKNIAG